MLLDGVHHPDSYCVGARKDVFDQFLGHLDFDGLRLWLAFRLVVNPFFFNEVYPRFHHTICCIYPCLEIGFELLLRLLPLEVSGALMIHHFRDLVFQDYLYVFQPSVDRYAELQNKPLFDSHSL